MHNQDNIKITTFREKMAWVMVVGLLSAAGFYLYALWNISFSMEQVPKPVIVVFTGMFIAILTIIAIIGAIGAALSNVDEADPPLDERDQLIAFHGARWSGIATGIILLLTIAAYFLDARSSDMLMGVMAALIVGHLVEYMVQIYLYRRKV